MFSCWRRKGGRGRCCCQRRTAPGKVKGGGGGTRPSHLLTLTASPLSSSGWLREELYILVLHKTSCVLMVACLSVMYGLCFRCFYFFRSGLCINGLNFRTEWCHNSCVLMSDVIKMSWVHLLAWPNGIVLLLLLLLWLLVVGSCQIQHEATSQPVTQSAGSQTFHTHITLTQL